MITNEDLPSLAAALLAVAGRKVGGLWIRARYSATRSAYLDKLETCLPEAARITPDMDDVALFGGIDIAASLSSGRKVLSDGVLARRGRVTLASAERASAAFSARLAGRLDAGLGPVVVLDEGADADQAPAPALTSRIGLFLQLDGVRAADLQFEVDVDHLTAAKALLPKVVISAGLETDLASLAGLYGVLETRACLFARNAALASAALAGRATVTEDDLQAALALVIAPRGQTPEMVEEAETPPSENEAPENGDTSNPEGSSETMEDRVAEAVSIALPEVLVGLVGQAARGASGLGQGSANVSLRRGRPLPSRPGAPGTGRRIDPVATIRAALPWQRLRPSPPGQRLALRRSDLRIKRYESRTERTIIFVVDASGSLAAARMAEAKGAVECLLAEAYRNRDEVALIAFRRTAAEVLLPPTRALVRARAALSALPGGGGTPLAAGLLTARQLAEHVKSAGATPMLVLLSDGRANVGLNGLGGRAQAGADATAVAQSLVSAGIDSLVFDTGRRPEPGLATLAARMGGRYVALPNADARALSTAVTDAMGR